MSVTIEACLLGDATGDGRINAADATRVKCMVAELYEGSELSILAADADGKNGMRAADATRILRYVAELIDSLQ